ncbi:sialidase family protein [Nonomuraea gerenzanensis]|uniref:Sialidase n=1 Tax=Nonomuraea gerenzanensis TaxID=93944 RepID=A0A1M4ENX1_9ACTN|nr:sialidase family protein [Nonomuraea gerenzanensis]UBU12041.1 glycoside hydrolase [Nonomuraea gerenzanensis]SBP00556.1 Sialidase [Nonomuraea gerenzanensis]
MIRPSRALLPAAVVLLACTVTQPAAADETGAPGNAVVRQVSGVSPLPTDCGPPPADGYTLNPSTEVLPMLARDPNRPERLVTVFQQDRWNRYGSNGTGVAVSDDRGLTWRQSKNRPAFSRCDGGDYDVATDHWVTVTPSGAAVAASLSMSRAGDVTAILVSRSGDGGRTWDTPVTLQRDDNVRFFNDRPSVTADPYRPGVVYAVWDRIDDQSTSTTPNWVQPVYLAKSTDDGRTWTTSKVYDVPVNSGVIGTQLVALPDGTLLIGMHHETITEGSTQVIRSTDGGRTWSAPTLNVPAPLAVGPRIPDPDDSGDPIRNAALPLLAAQPGTRVVNAVWPSQDPDGTFHVAYSRSADGGKTWSGPIRVDRTPTGSAAVPVVAASRTGTVAITYYDFRNNTPDPATLPTDLWAVTCASDCTKPGAWRERHVEGPFDTRKVPLTSVGRLLGDYTGLVSTGSTFTAVYGVATDDAANPVDLHSAIFAG